MSRQVCYGVLVISLPPDCFPDSILKKVFELHGVSPFEIVEALENDIGFRMENPVSKDNESYVIFSETSHGRVLALIFEVKKKKHQLITAFDPDFDEWKLRKAEYEQARNT